jgi:hypothetical protein
VLVGDVDTAGESDGSPAFTIGIGVAGTGIRTIG